MTSREHPTATITTPNSTPGQSGRFGSESVAAFVGMRSVATDSRGDVYIAEVSWTTYGSKLEPPREVRSLQKWALAEPDSTN